MDYLLQFGVVRNSLRKVTKTKGVKIPTYELGKQLEEEFWVKQASWNPCKTRILKNASKPSTPLVRGKKE